MANGKSPLKILGPEVIGLLALFILILGILNYFNILSLSRLYPDKFASLPHQTPKSVQKIPTPVLTLKCPVPQELCDAAEVIVYKNNPALAYKLPDDTPITSIAPIVDSLQSVEQPYKKTNPKILHQSYINNNQCHVVTYVFPYDSILKIIDLLPLAQGTEIAATGASLNTITTDSKKYNLIIQIQKRALGSGQYDFQKCGVTNLTSKDFGHYEDIDKNTFK